MILLIAIDVLIYCFTATINLKAGGGFRNYKWGEEFGVKL